MTTRSRRLRVVLIVLVAGSFLGSTRSGDAQSAPTPTLGGFQGTAAASGLHALYNPSGLLPIPPLVDIGAPDAFTTIASGPSTFARASVLDPGDLLANPDALLSLSSEDYPSGTVPAYPFRVSASSGSGQPNAESVPGPGLNARVTATNERSSAQATMPALDATAVATVGSMSAKATTHTDGSMVTVTARSEAHGVNVLGIIAIDSVVTDLSATSDGAETKLTGGTRVVGATVLGMPVSIDAEGIHQAPGTPPLLAGLLDPVTGLNEVLAQVGIHVTAAAPVELAGGSAGQLASSGLRIDFELSPQTFPQLAALVDALPPLDNPVPGTPSIEDVLALAQARHLTSLDIGRGFVALNARPAASFPPITPPSMSPSAPISEGSLPTFDLPDAPLPASTPPASPAPDAPVLVSDEPELPAGASVGALVLLALLAQPFIGEALARFSMAVLATNRSASCFREER